MGNWSEYEQEELARQAEWLKKERAKGYKAGWKSMIEAALEANAAGPDPVKPKEKPPLLGRLKALFGPKNA